MEPSLFLLINRTWTNSVLDRIMAAASSWDLWLPLAVTAGLLVLWRGGRRARWFLLCLGLALAIGDGLVSQSLKRMVHKPRPFQAIAGVRQIDLDRHAKPRALALFRPLDIRTSSPPPPGGVGAAGRSFPSSHTVNNFAVATLLTLFYRRRGAWYFLPAALVGYSRIYVGSHWPEDVFASACLTVGAVLLAAAAVERFRMQSPRFKAATSLKTPNPEIPL